MEDEQNSTRGSYDILLNMMEIAENADLSSLASDHPVRSFLQEGMEGSFGISAYELNTVRQFTRKKRFEEDTRVVLSEDAVQEPWMLNNDKK
ncbi:MAG: hypothetical protein JWM56_153 [Candidatus Peribacteria bacterium]|nr:hypothetical protein [Candidatus Peribacteria bacterium]